MDIYTKDCMTFYSELSIDSKPKKSTKVPKLVGPHVHMHSRCEVSMTICMGSRVNQRKV